MRVRDASTDSAWPWGEQFVHTSKSYVCACVSKRELLSLSSTCTDSDSSDTRQISGKLQGVAPVWELTCFVCSGENPKELRLSQTPKEVSSISTSATDPKKEKSTPVESV